MDNENRVERVIISQHEVSAKYGLSRSAIYRMMMAEGMPQPVRLTGRRKGWFVKELDEYFANRPRGLVPCAGSGQYAR